MTSFFSNGYTWYGCTKCKRYYALTLPERLEDGVPCPQGHSMSDGFMLSKQWQELTCLWGLFTALYFEQEKPRPWVSFAQLELAGQFQRALKERGER